MLCNIIPIRSQRRRLREKILTPREPKKGWELCYQKILLLEQLIKISTDIRTLPKTESNLSLIQSGALCILSEFAQIMKENNISWWLDSGTLIGYVRHNGFIPWDDDVDIAMLRKDYEKLPNILKGDFEKKGFFFRVGEITRLYFGDLRLWVDIFPMDTGFQTTPLSGTELQSFIKKIDKIKAKMVFDGLLWLKRESPVTSSYLEYCRKERIKLLGENECDKGFIFYGVETCAKDRTLFKYEDIFPLRAVNFLGLTAYIPNNTEKYLYSMYGDFMCWPKHFEQRHDSSLAKNMTLHERDMCKELISKYYPKTEAISCNENK